ncbi:MAG: ORF6N domain-containing protein [Candidatus Lindowbacteria bacterium]|nr:ORF6N domain-containing protein [Candidatus Lindowbacteria bacterium]
MDKKTNLRADAVLEKIAGYIFEIRGQRVILDEDIARLYEVETKVLNQAVSRNSDRFPPDFMFSLIKGEFPILKSQFVTSRWGGRRKLPRAFTEQGVEMLSGVLKSRKAVEVNIAIMRVFVNLRRRFDSDGRVIEKIDELEERVGTYDLHIQEIFKTLRYLTTSPPKPKRKIRFQALG